MALHWNIENCNENNCWYKIPKEQLEKEAKEKKDNPNKIQIFSITREERDDGIYQMNTELYVLIMLSMQVGMDKITEKNYVQFYNRINFIENMNGKGFMIETIYEGGKKVQKDKKFTLDIVKKYIGLETNTHNTSRAKFIRIHTQHLNI